MQGYVSGAGLQSCNGTGQMPSVGQHAWGLGRIGLTSVSGEKVDRHDRGKEQ